MFHTSKSPEHALTVRMFREESLSAGLSFFDVPHEHLRRKVVDQIGVIASGIWVWKYAFIICVISNLITFRYFSFLTFMKTMVQAIVDSDFGDLPSRNNSPIVNPDERRAVDHSLNYFNWPLFLISKIKL